MPIVLIVMESYLRRNAMPARKLSQVLVERAL